MGFFYRIEEDIFLYAKKNLAVVNVYIKDPVVTRIKRDQKIPVIAFVANTGGLLGLCMGFSLVSVFEIVYHMVGAFRKWTMAKYGATTTTTASATSRTASLNGGPHGELKFLYEKNFKKKKFILAFEILRHKLLILLH